MEQRNNPKIEFTVEELREAVFCYEHLLASEIKAAYSVMLAVPQFGLKVAQTLQFAAKMAANGKMDKSRVLDTALLPAFLVGVLLGFSRKLKRVLLEPRSYDDQMAVLEECVGKAVRVEYVSYGRFATHEWMLERVDPYLLLKFPNDSMPFIGSGCAIRRILLIASQNWEQVVYFNQHVAEGYDIRDQAEVEKFKVKVWGPLPPLKKKD